MRFAKIMVVVSMHHSCWLLWPHVFFSNAGITVTTQSIFLPSSPCLFVCDSFCEMAFQLHLLHLVAISACLCLCCERDHCSFTKVIFLPSSPSYFSVFLQCIVRGGNTATSNASSCLLPCCHLYIFQQWVVRGGFPATFNASSFLQCELWETMTDASSCLLTFHMKQCSCLVEHEQCSFWQTINMQE